ncbi:hypothetical protein P879_05941 [Paragonimus westermani]|uniref:Major facilitator superfamily (MFS) profile domain-containing protein n=1 Tax=Paragonimus westermani TaxID=34504 RepID=A0A8T0DGZ5_9TREM|nr:hypothetical protein P879_05941 [Paragonimus westermani]
MTESTFGLTVSRQAAHRSLWVDVSAACVIATGASGGASFTARVDDLVVRPHGLAGLVRTLALSIECGRIGLGLGFSVVRVVGIAAEYFEIYRTLALAVCTSGAGLGTFVYSKLGAHMIDTYSWRVALMGYALIHLNIIPICFILRPLPPEPAAEPTVLIPAHPELKVCEMLTTNSSDLRNVEGQNALLRVSSVNTVYASNMGNNLGAHDAAGQCSAVCTPSKIRSCRTKLKGNH